MNRRLLTRIILSFGSGGSLLLFICGWVVYYVTVFIWSEEALSKFVAALNNNIVVQVVTFLFLLSFLIYLVRGAVKITKRHKWMLPLWVIFPAGAFLFALGFYLNATFSNEGKIVVGEGDSVQPPWETVPVELVRIDPGLKEELLGIDSIDSTIFQYEPTVLLRGQSGEHLVRGFPATKIGSSYYHILDFGLAPGIRVSRDGRVILESHVIQRLIPPGKVDSFFLGNLPYRVEIRITPSRVIRKGDTEAPVFDLKDLHFTVLIYRGETLIYEGPSGEGISFDGLRLEFTPYIYWVRMEAAQRPGMIPLSVGIALLVTGFPLWLGIKIFYLARLRRMNSE
jgi:hypothetical protein